MKANAIAILSLLIFSSNCRAADWWLIHTDMDSVSFIDLESIKDYEYTKKKSWIQAFNRDGTSARTLFIYNCKNEEVGVKATYTYNADGKSKSSDSVSYINFNPVAPETFGYELLQVSCADNPKSQLNVEIQSHKKLEISPEEYSKNYFKLIK